MRRAAASAALGLGLLAGGSARAADAILAARFTSDGVHRTYAVYAPPGESPRPLLILLHGSGGSGREMVRRWRELARREGFVVAGPDARIPDRWEPPGDGPVLLRDLVDALRSLQVDDRRVYLFGHSAGAVFALHMATLESSYFAAAASHAGAFGGEAGLEFLGAATRRIPLFLCAGTEDALYPPSAVRATVELLERAGFPVRSRFFPGGGHAYEPSGEVNEAAWAFLRQHRLAADPVFVPAQFGVAPKGAPAGTKP